MNCTIKINMDNAAFEDYGIATELSAILEGLLQTIRDGGDECNLYDTNGNKVGLFKITGGKR